MKEHAFKALLVKVSGARGRAAGGHDERVKQLAQVVADLAARAALGERDHLASGALGGLVGLRLRPAQDLVQAARMRAGLQATGGDLVVVRLDPAALVAAHDTEQLPDLPGLQRAV